VAGARQLCTSSAPSERHVADSASPPIAGTCSGERTDRRPGAADLTAGRRAARGRKTQRAGLAPGIAGYVGMARPYSATGGAMEPRSSNSRLSPSRVRASAMTAQSAGQVQGSRLRLANGAGEGSWRLRDYAIVDAVVFERSGCPSGWRGQAGLPERARRGPPARAGSICRHELGR